MSQRNVKWGLVYLQTAPLQCLGCKATIPSDFISLVVGFLG